MRTTQVSVFHVLFENVTRLNPVYHGGKGGDFVGCGSTRDLENVKFLENS